MSSEIFLLLSEKAFNKNENQAEAEVVPSSCLVEVEVEVGVVVGVGGDRGWAYLFGRFLLFWLGGWGAGWGGVVGEVRDKAISTQVVVELS